MLTINRTWTFRGPVFFVDGHDAAAKLKNMIIKQALLGNLVTDECIRITKKKERVNDE